MNAANLLVDLVEVAVVVQVVGLDVRHEHRARRQVRERLVALVGLHHVVPARPRVRVRAVGAHDAADEERGVLAHGVQHAGQHGRRGGLAVRARHGKRLQVAAQVREHLRTVPDGQAPLLGGDELGVVVQDGRGHHHHVGRGVVAPGAARQVGRVVADAHVDAGGLQLLGVAALLEIRPAHAQALVEGDARDAAHAHPAHADEVNRFYALCVHDILNCPSLGCASMVANVRYRAAPITTSANLAAASAVFCARAAAAMRSRTPASSRSERTSRANSGPSTSASASMYAQPAST